MLTIVKISAERTDFSLRLRETLLSAHGLPPSPTVVAREFNFRFVGKPITVHAARKWLVGDAIPTQDKLRALARWLDVSIDWLRFGSQAGSAPTEGVSPHWVAATPEADLMRLFLTLPHRERILAKDFIEMLSLKNQVRGRTAPTLVALMAPLAPINQA
jgi:hypothetical protein